MTKNNPSMTTSVKVKDGEKVESELRIVAVDFLQHL